MMSYRPSFARATEKPMLHRYKAALLTAAIFTGGCASKALDQAYLPNNNQYRATVVTTPDFDIQTVQPTAHTADVLRVYIEGDGRAWATSRTASTDPTPTQSLMLQYQQSDATPSVYMARVCQFVQSDSCNKQVWTDQRFSGAVIQSHSHALDQLKTKYGNQQFELVGYSGGAAVALLLAAGRDDIAQVQTIAGNLDHAAWTTTLKIRPLEGSLNPSDYALELRQIPQRLIMGMNDPIIPSEVLQAYTKSVQPACAEVHVVPADHWEGFDEVWDEVKDVPVECLAQSSSTSTR
jgi:hypothetical protein